MWYRASWTDSKGADGQLFKNVCILEPKEEEKKRWKEEKRFKAGLHNHKTLYEGCVKCAFELFAPLKYIWEELFFSRSTDRFSLKPGKYLDVVDILFGEAFDFWSICKLFLILQDAIWQLWRREGPAADFNWISIFEQKR